MSGRLQVISPVDGEVLVERPLADEREIDAALDWAKAAQAGWQATPVAERGRVLYAAVDAFTARTDEIALEITRQMGRPIRFTPKEVAGFEERARTMIELAAGALADLEIEDKPGFRRFIRRLPLGVVLVVAPWNYPYLTAVNGVWPALMAGNAVILKPSAQTPLSGERMAEALQAAGLPGGVFQVLHLSHEAAVEMIGSGRVDFVSFTGSVAGGAAIERAVAGRFVGTTLELGGKDPAYVRADADLEDAIENLGDGAFFNSGQSCCAIERIYVDRKVYQPFVDGLIELARSYRLDDPTDPETTVGPMVRPGAADAVREQVAAAVRAGAKAHVRERGFERSRPGSAYLAPEVLTAVNHQMAIMNEETFGPAIGVMPVKDDDEAIRLMNDSRYGLTASIWTRDVEAAIRIGEQVETGTFFMNRCDYLDPMLAWTGVKDSGRGCSLSRLQYAHLTRPKSFHLKLAG